MVLLAYIDESYSEDALAVACVAVHERQMQGLTLGLADHVGSVSRRFPSLSPSTELHAYELAGGRGPWKPLTGMTRARLTIYHGALEIVREHSENVLVHRVIPGPARGDDSARGMHVSALGQVLARLDAYSHRSGERCLVFADQVSYQEELGEVFDTAPRTALIDTLHFASSRMSRPIQAADLVAYLARRRVSGPSGSRTSSRRDGWLWSVISPSVDLVDEGEGAS